MADFSFYMRLPHPLADTLIVSTKMRESTFAEELEELLLKLSSGNHQVRLCYPLQVFACALSITESVCNFSIVFYLLPKIPQNLDTYFFVSLPSFSDK
jgi:hypothetical protein